MEPSSDAADSNRRHLLLPKSTLRPALVSGVLCWLAFPPVGWSFLAWVAPIGWLALILSAELPGRRPYRSLWLAGFVFWLLTIHWIRLPHPMNYLGWVALSAYLGCYLPVFVGLSRVGVHRLGGPLWLVAPIVWTGLDLVRAHLMTGFLMGSLAHTQVDYLPVIQCADLVGEYGVTFAILLVASCLAQSIAMPQTSTTRRFLTLLPAAIVLICVLAYGERKSADEGLAQKVPTGPRIAIIQGNTPVDWKADSDRQQKIMAEHARLTSEALAQSRQQDGRSVDLIIWPETMYRNPLFTVEEGYVPPADRISASDLVATQRDLREFVRQTESAILVGIDRYDVFPDATGQPDYRGYNSSVLVDKQGEVVGTYDKMHLVVMGEYVPFSDWIPALKRLTPMTGFAEAGVSPSALALDGVVYSPNICYETCVPHLIRRQVQELTTAGAAPDVLVNLTNDAWFRGSSELDLHLACGIFRAVEMRRPLVIAANGGLSGFVDSYGSVRQVTPRQQTVTLLVDLPLGETPGLTFYARHGDWFAGLCLICCIVLAIAGWRHRRRAKLQ